MDLRVLGAVEVHNGHKLAIGGPRQRRILAALAAQAGEVVSLDRLVDISWADETMPKQAEANVRTYVHRVRQCLGDELADRLETSPPGYVFRVQPGELDTDRFEAACTEAARLRERGDDEGALAVLDDGLALWRGEPYAEFADEEWVRVEAMRLRELRAGALELKCQVLLELDRAREALAHLDGLVEEHPLREGPRALRMQALYHSGRQAEALRAFQDYRNYLIDEAGVAPTDDLVELDRAIASGELVGTKPTPHVHGYELHELIGSGAFADVHRGVQPALDREVAVKSVKAELANRPEFIRGFEAEASIIARLEHPHIVPLYDYWREPGGAYLVMRWLTGGSLESRLDLGPWSIEDTVRMVEQIGSALALAHRAGVVHRDVKTANILLDEESNAYLTDFGIAVEADGMENPAAVLSQGSPAYAAPEQLRREEVGPTADIFGLGIAAFETLSGRLPFPDAQDKASLLQRQLHDPIPPVSKTRPDLPVALDAVLAKCTAKDPEARYQDVGSFVTAFVEVLAESPTASPVVRESARRVTEISGTVDNPYKGLAAFAEGDAGEFFGRERLVDELVERLDQQSSRRNFLAVVGPSGSGKSSVVKAGLVPALRAGRVRGSEAWFFTSMTPGRHPFESLETALLRIAVNPPATLLDQLKADRRGIIRGVRRILPDDGATAVLVIDQFEELFTLCDDDEARTQFLEALAIAATDETASLRVIITLRADFYDQPLRHAGIADLLKHQSVTITPLAPDELENAIVRPALSVGAEFEPGLVAEIMADVASQPGGLPLMQYALTQLFEARVSGMLMVGAYREIGGLSGALARQADDLFEALGDPQRAAARRLFGRLVSLGEGSEDTRRRVPRSELGTDDAATERVIDVYGHARLLSFDRDPATREPTIEVAHEALIREWPRLRDWLEADRDGLRLLRGVTDASQRWDAGGRDPADLLRGGRLEAAVEFQTRAPGDLSDTESEFLEASLAAEEARVEGERRVTQRLRRLLVGAAIFAVLAAAAGAVAFWQRSSARDAQVAAEAAEFRAETRRLAADAGQIVETSRTIGLLLAAEAHRRDPGPETLGAVQQVLTKTDEYLGLRGAEHAYSRIRWAPDGSAVYAMRPEGVDLLPVDGSPPRTVFTGDAGEDLAVSDDGERLAVATRTRDVVVIVDLDSGMIRSELPHESQVRTLAFLPGGRSLVTGDRDGWLSVWDVDAGTRRQVHAHPEAEEGDLPPELAPPEDTRHEAFSLPVGIGNLIVTPDGRDVFTSGGVFVRRWRVEDLTMSMESGIRRRDASGEALIPGTPGRMALADDGRRLFVAVQVIGQVIDAQTGELLDEFRPGLTATIPDNFDLALGHDLIVLIGPLMTRLAPDTLEPVETTIGVEPLLDYTARPGLALSKDGQTAAIIAPAGVRLFALDGSSLISRSAPIPEGVGAIQMSSDGRHVMGTNLRSAPVLIDMDRPDEPPKVTNVADAFWGHTDTLGFPVVWQRAEGGLSLAVAIDLETGEPTGETLGPLGFSAGAVSPDGGLVAVGSAFPDTPVSVRVFDRETGLLVSPLLGSEHGAAQVFGLAWSPDQQYLIAILDGGPTVVFDVETWQPLLELAPAGSRLVAASFSPDGRYLATADFFGSLWVRDASALPFQPIGVELRIGGGGPAGEALRRLEFTADSRFLVTAHPEVSLIDVETWTVIGDPLRQEASTAGNRSSIPEGARFVSTVDDGRVRVWELNPDDWPEIACLAAGRNFTLAEWEQFGPSDEPYEATCPQWPIESDATS